MKRLLIISPYFPPVNAADMQRIRMSLPYFKECNWEAEVVTVDAQFADMPKDDLLCQSLPPDIKIHRVKALNKSWTSKLGLGSIALRALYFYKKKVDRLLKTNHFDLIYFSTTQFPVCILGAYWKRKWGIPYVIDFQDPWHSNYYLDKPRAQRPPKYWFSYRLNRYMEPIALKHVDGLISVSQAYLDNLRMRYPQIARIPASVITFGYSAPDLLIAAANSQRFQQLLNPEFKNMVYIGRGGADLHSSLKPLFRVLSTHSSLFKNIRLYFIGTSYAPAGTGTPSILPLAGQFGIAGQVTELTDRISYYHTLATLQQADALFIPGSDDPAYTASKIYPYLLSYKPLLAIFNPHSPAVDTLTALGAKQVYSYNNVPETALMDFLIKTIEGTHATPSYNTEVLKKYSAQETTVQQCALFDQVINKATPK